MMFDHLSFKLADGLLLLRSLAQKTGFPVRCNIDLFLFLF